MKPSIAPSTNAILDLKIASKNVRITTSGRNLASLMREFFWRFTADTAARPHFEWIVEEVEEWQDPLLERAKSDRFDRCYYLGPYPILNEWSFTKGAPKKIVIYVAKTHVFEMTWTGTNLLNLMRYFLLQNKILILHCAMMVRDGKGIAFLGSAGSGKTSAALTLLKMNFDYVADDSIALTLGASRKAYASNRQMHIMNDAFGRFKELGFAKERELLPHGPRLKRTVSADEFVPRERILRSAHLHFLVFLRRGEKPVFEKMSPAEALLEALKLSGIDLVSDPSSLAPLLKVFSGFRSYRLHEADFEELARRAEEIVSDHA